MVLIEAAKTFFRDARHAQLLVLGSLLAMQFAAIDFAVTPANLAGAVAASLGTQWALGRWRGVAFDPRSALISGLSLALLLRASSPLWLVLAGVLAIGSKFLLRFDGRPIFNPSAFAIVALLASGAGVWVSPGQWGAELWFAGLILVFGSLVLSRAGRWDIALFYLVSHFGLLLWRAFRLGDPLAIPLHQIESGSLLIFCAFMITDPRTTPSTRGGRFLFAFVVAVLAHQLAFSQQMRPALYVALILLNPMVVLIDRSLAALRRPRRAALFQGAPA